jgi:NAD(P)-dependent dehydrogenase (short-subunit alcohol dehydrogenase family)
MHDLFDLSGRVAIVTGATKGMGLAIARALGTAGAKIVLSSRNAESAKLTEERPGRTNGITSAGFACDIADSQSVLQFAELAQAAFGRVDALVLSADAPAPTGSLLKQTPRALTTAMEGSLVGNLLLVNTFLPAMIERKNGSVIVMSSYASRRGTKLLGLYAMVQAATDQFVRNLVVEIGASNVNVNSINPGAVRTDFSRILWEDPATEVRAAAAIPLGRIAEPNDVAGLALLLAADAGRYITGQSILVDGGRSVA